MNTKNGIDKLKALYQLIEDKGEFKLQASLLGNVSLNTVSNYWVSKNGKAPEYLVPQLIELAKQIVVQEIEVKTKSYHKIISETVFPIVQALPKV